MNRAARPSGPAADHARLQPGDGAAEIDDWLADAEFDLEADSVGRLGGDQELLLNLQLSKFSDSTWNPVAEELARYGFAVIRCWVRRRTIFHKVRARTKYGLPVLEDWPDEESAADIATDTVVDALRYFKDKVLIAGKWDPERGASLRTYFIGQCLFQFANRYRPQYEAELEKRATQLLIGDDDELAALIGSLRGIEDAVMTQHDVAAALSEVSTARARTAFILQAQGYSHREIADKLGVLDEKTIDNMLTYQKKRVRKTS